jgi:glycosyltransferase involved in cell wall biosynthesis
MDWTIYQSEFCLKSFASEGADVSRSTVIFNGVDLEVFVPAERPLDIDQFRLIMVSWSPNILRGGPDAVRASQIPGVEVTFVGNWPVDLDPGQVKVIPPKRHDILSMLLRQHHALLHMAQNDPCSNAALEGMASGLPVIYHPSGGSPEIVGECGVACTESLQDAVYGLRDRYRELRAKTMARRSEFSIDRAAQQYLDIFQRLGKVPLI